MSCWSDAQRRQALTAVEQRELHYPATGVQRTREVCGRFLEVCFAKEGPPTQHRLECVHRLAHKCLSKLVTWRFCCHQTAVLQLWRWRAALAVAAAPVCAVIRPLAASERCPILSSSGRRFHFPQLLPLRPSVHPRDLLSSWLRSQLSRKALEVCQQ